MLKNILLFNFGFGLVAIVKSQTSSIEPSTTCGYIDGSRFLNDMRTSLANNYMQTDSDLALACTSKACGFLFIFGHDKVYAGRCGDVSCAIETTCIESGTALNSHTVQW
jgi:hypothetical protein